MLDYIESLLFPVWHLSLSSSSFPRFTLRNQHGPDSLVSLLTVLFGTPSLDGRRQNRRHLLLTGSQRVLALPLGRSEQLPHVILHGVQVGNTVVPFQRH